MKRDVESKSTGLPFLLFLVSVSAVAFAFAVGINWGGRSSNAKQMRDEIVSNSTHADVMDLCVQIRKLEQEIVAQGLDDDNIFTVETGAYTKTVEATKPIRALCVQSFFGQVKFVQIQSTAKRLPELNAPVNCMPTILVIFVLVVVFLMSWRKKAL